MRLLGLGLLLAACAREPVEAVYDDPVSWERDLRLAVQQTSGEVHWVIPAQRALGIPEFGTPGNPRNWADVPSDADPAVAVALARYPTLIGVPLALRGNSPDLLRWTETLIDVPYGGPLVPVTGELRVVADDRILEDPPGPSDATPDQASATATFTDPLGHDYRIELRQVIAPPFPGWDSAGGVLHAEPIHGVTGTGSPLMPEAFAWLAVFGLGDVYVDGVLTNSNMLVAIETIETVRDRDGRLVQTPELPLEDDDTIAGQAYHTHLFVFPIRFSGDEPVYDAVSTRMALAGGDLQDVVHVIYERPVLVDGPPFARP